MDDERPDYVGMTVNERLSIASLLSEFDAAIESGKRQRAIETLGRVALVVVAAAERVDTIMRDPSRYGYPCGT